MRGILLAVVAGSALAWTLPHQAFAGPYGAEPYVIPGVDGSSYASGPAYDPAAGYVRQPRAYGGVAPRPMQPQPAYPMPARPVAQSRLGGGLLEALMGEDAPRAAPLPVPGVPAARYRAYAYNNTETQVEPYGNPVYAVAPQKAPDPMFQRQAVAYDGKQTPGTIVIDTASKFLYLVGEHGQAMRYGIGVGRLGFVWKGTETISRKAEWPDWTPPAEMRQRRPDLPSHMEGGIANPLGARAMYLGSTLYRIHGTNEPDTIGTNVSSGCIRLTNEDVTDLYSHVRVGTRVVVL